MRIKTEIMQTIIILLFSIFFCAVQSEGHEDDPFYLNLLKKGEHSFLAGDYKNAVKNLEIVCFGIQNNKIRAKAYVYLGLSHYYMKDERQGNIYLREAEDIIGLEGLNALDINEEVKFDLNRLTQAFKSGNIVNPEGLQALPRVPTERVTQRDNPGIEQLKKGIDRNPQNIFLYYDLYSHYRLQNNSKRAKKTIEKLVKNNPREVFGYYVLGIIQYQERKYKDAVSSFKSFFQLSKDYDIGQDTLAEATAYQILTLYYRGERDGAAQLIAASKGILSGKKSLGFHLEDKDKIVLRNLLKEIEK